MLFIVDLKLFGKYVMEDVYKVGGISAVLKYLMFEGMIDGFCMIVIGKIFVENFVICLDLMLG